MFSVFSLRVPWSALPKWARWVAKNSNGIIWCFEDEPIVDLKRGEWGAFGRSDKIGLSDSGVNWEASLTKRPDKQEENKVDENKLPVIDISKTFQAYVWDGDNEPKYDGCDEIREIVAIFSNGGCIDSHLAVWEYYELIKEPTFRPFRNRDEFIQWLRDTGRTDMRYIHPNGTLFTLNTILTDTIFSDYLDCKWFDNGEPIGVRE